MKEKAIDFLEGIAHLENEEKVTFNPDTEEYNVHQEHIEICRWLISILQGGLAHMTKYPGQKDEEEWVRIK